MSSATFRLNDTNSNTFARFPVKNNISVTTILSADGTTPKKILEGSTTVLGSRISKILISSNDTSRVINLFLHNGTIISELPFISFSIADGSTNKVYSNILNIPELSDIIERDNNGNKFFMLDTNYSIYASVDSSVTSLKTIQFSSWVEDY